MEKRRQRGGRPPRGGNRLARPDRTLGTDRLGRRRLLVADLPRPAARFAGQRRRGLRAEGDSPRARRRIGPRELLAREALVGGSVSNPHLVAVLESGVSRGRPFLVMPWLAGQTLEARLAAGEAIDLPESLGIIRQAAEALAALDDGGWIHGDVKPSNILVSNEGHATLLDLGLARRRGESGEMMDRSVMGALHYLAPECLASAAAADVRSDIYSLGAALFQILAGRLPREADAAAELVLLRRQAAPPDLSKLVPSLPRAAAVLVRRMLANEPLRRPQSPGELIRALTDLEIATFSERATA